MNGNYYVKVPRLKIGAILCLHRLIGFLRRHCFISFVVWLCLNVCLVLDILVSCGYFVDLKSANARVTPSSPLFPSDFALEERQIDVRLLCWISSPFVNRENENSIRETWGKRCDKLIFVTNSSVDIRPTNQIGKGDGIVRLFAKRTADVLKHLHDYHLNDSDWFLKADARTYVVVDQLKMMLSIRDPATPCYLAATINTKNNSEIIGDAYVLSRESIRRLVRQFRRRNAGGGLAGCDDWSHHLTANNNLKPVAKAVSASFHCLDRLGIISLNTQDERGCERFLSRSLATELINDGIYSGTLGRCISDKVVIFARLGEHDFYLYEHLLYRLKMPTNIM